MRTLIIMRHANAAWGSSLGDDRSRALDPRGRVEASAATARFRAAGLAPEVVYCSAATRTRETLDLVLEAFDPAPVVHHEDELYGASAGMLLATARSLRNESHDATDQPRREHDADFTRDHP